ncbi:MAG: hypothetical protein CL988_01825 [Euryarchaeota archaeon]|nr:hypothetical protein [Euryarchaeota archaeon]
MPVSNGNSKVKFRVNPGPRDEIPDWEATFLPSLVTTAMSSPPIGIAASLVISTVTKRTSSSSSSMSISTDDNRAARDDVRTVWSSLMCSTLEATLLSPTSRQCNNNQG